MSRAANQIRVIHLCNGELNPNDKKAFTLCGYHLPAKEITDRIDKVNCFWCIEELEREEQHGQN